MTRADFDVIGGQEIGEKAGMLREHILVIEDVGLTIPHTTVIASEAVQPLQNPDGNLNAVTKHALESAVNKNEAAPVLAVRSSAEGDASGNGVYKSRFATNNLGLVLKAAGIVTESFSTNSAKDFRRQAKLGEAFALMVQPVVGQDLDSTEYWEHFGPYLSGFGYSSSLKQPDGYINVVAGIGGGVSRKGGQVVARGELDTIIEKTTLLKRFRQSQGPLSFYEFLEALEEAALHGHIEDIRNDFRSGDRFSRHELTKNGFALAEYLMREAGTEEYRYQSSGLLSAGMQADSGKVDDDGYPKFAFEESEFVGVTKAFKPTQLLEAMRKIEEIAGYPVYVEWALDATGDEPKPVILQLAPAETTARSKQEIQLQGKVMAEARHILGNGTRQANKIVVLRSPTDVAHLHEFNRDPNNEGYILVFGSSLTGPYTDVQLEYSDCSNAAALLEVKSEDHRYQHANGDIVQHLFGSSRQTDKFIGELSSNIGEADDDIWSRTHTKGKVWQADSSSISRYSEYGQLRVLDGMFTVYADEAAGTVIVADDESN